MCSCGLPSRTDAIAASRKCTVDLAIACVEVHMQCILIKIPLSKLYRYMELSRTRCEKFTQRLRICYPRGSQPLVSSRKRKQYDNAFGVPCIADIALRHTLPLQPEWRPVIRISYIYSVGRGYRSSTHGASWYCAQPILSLR